MAITQISSSLIADGAVAYDKLAIPTYEAQASSDTLVAADYGRTIYCTGLTGDITITLPSASAVGSGWWVRIVRGPNDNGEDVTISRAGSDVIEYGSDAGLTSLLLTGDGDYMDMVSTGSSWVALGQLRVHLNVYPDFPLGASGQTVSTGSYTDVLYDTVNSDSHSGFNASTYEYTVPFSGNWYVTASAIFETGSGTDYFASIDLFLSGSGATVSFGGTVPADTANNSFQQIQASGIWNYQKGDVLKVRVAHTHGSNRQINDSDFINENANMTLWEMTRLGNRR
jgi:hypothetical protein